MNDILFRLFTAVAIAAVSAVCRYLIPLLISHLRESRHALAADIVERVVRAVEQMITEPGAGEKRYEQALRILHELLPEYRIYISDEQIQILIESVVETINEERRLLQAAAE